MLLSKEYRRLMSQPDPEGDIRVVVQAVDEQDEDADAPHESQGAQKVVDGVSHDLAVGSHVEPQSVALVPEGEVGQEVVRMEQFEDGVGEEGFPVGQHAAHKRADDDAPLELIFPPEALVDEEAGQEEEGDEALEDEQQVAETEFEDEVGEEGGGEVGEDPGVVNEVRVADRQEVASEHGQLDPELLDVELFGND